MPDWMTKFVITEADNGISNRITMTLVILNLLDLQIFKLQCWQTHLKYVTPLSFMLEYHIYQ